MIIWLGLLTLECFWRCFHKILSLPIYNCKSRYYSKYLNCCIWSYKKRPCTCRMEVLCFKSLPEMRLSGIRWQLPHKVMRTTCMCSKVSLTFSKWCNLFIDLRIKGHAEILDDIVFSSPITKLSSFLKLSNNILKLHANSLNILLLILSFGCLLA